MNVYNNLNDMIDYIESHLDNDIQMEDLVKFVGVNEYTLQRLFPLICNVTLMEYIRKRRLTLAGKDLVQDHVKVIDVAIKYGYESSTAFSRAFMKFHGIKPSEVKKNASKLKYYPRLQFSIPKIDEEIEYEIITLPKMTLYGLGVKTNNATIKKDAPNLYQEVAKKYPNFPHPLYGMVVYEDRFNSDDYEYWVLWKEKHPDWTKKVIPASRWLKFRIPSCESRDIQEMSDLFYYKFLPTCKYNLKSDPELEYYHDGVTDFLIPIY